VYNRVVHCCGVHMWNPHVHSTAVYNSVVHYCGKKLFMTHPHFGMTPQKVGGGGPCKMWGVLKKNIPRFARKNWTPPLQTRGDAHA